MILHLYFARRFAKAFLTVAAIFLGILVALDFVDQIRRYEGEGVSFRGVLGLTLLSVPQTFYTILPLIVILAALTQFLSLARTSELVVTRAAGRSALRSLLAPVAVALVVGAVSVAVLNPIVAATSRAYDAASDRLTGRGGSALSLAREGVWLRQGDAGGQTVIRAARASGDGTSLYNVSFLGFSAAGVPSFRIEAAAAHLQRGNWQVEDAKEWRFDSANPERDAQRHAALALPSTLTPEEILDGFSDPAEVPIWDLPAFIERLDRAGFSALRHQVWLQMELALPLLLAAMVLVGAGFTMRPARAGRTGMMVLLALGMGFGLFFVRNFAQILGENGQLPVALAAWGPPVAALLLPLGLLLHWEDG
ncbi:C-terminal of permease YjgP/YjgQ family protein [Oceaniovalibus guishaninsula JLT2003]|uniref:C-terminal of permease YjgP/YjgQ family protein n=1 Tax=Oceaniovalibus guishaninsula JLT2003 TaxID=1231392 RepID=K2HT67_9RHOB|nr:LPS export ABC transporter permease LptG [Oceaniovalibus guishaninsula]EKE45819.1 C-terminal of permease YjgP/YjgQ family protein [Oceaniovalibus guishaninsula JLT2003]